MSGANLTQRVLDFGVGWDDVHVSAMRVHFLARERGPGPARPIAIPALPLPEFQSINDGLVGHLAPADGKIERREIGAAIKPIRFRVEDEGTDVVLGQRSDLALAHDPMVVRAGRALRGFFGNEDAGRVARLDRVDEIDHDADREEGEDRGLHRNECNGGRGRAER